MDKDLIATRLGRVSIQLWLDTDEWGLGFEVALWSRSMALTFGPFVFEVGLRCITPRTNPVYLDMKYKAAQDCAPVTDPWLGQDEFVCACGGYVWSCVFIEGSGAFAWSRRKVEAGDGEWEMVVTFDVPNPVVDAFIKAQLR